MKLIIISNRLPVTVALEKQNIKIRPSAGGLVTGLSDYLNSLKGGKDESVFNFKPLWIGWPGEELKDSLADEVRAILQREFNSYPVFIPSGLMDNFYNGFCNKTIWPLFHYFPSHAVFDESQWAAYEKVNEIFFQEISPVVEPGDTVWVHDYHLMLLPQLLRERFKKLTIGFFLHIPFPSYEMFRLLPRRWGIKILEGMLGADLIGFHTHDYTQHFLKCVLSILGYEHSMGKVLLKDRMIKAETIPMGINFKKFYDLASSKEIEKEKTNLKVRLLNQKVILSIDRLDYTKGILNRLESYEVFLSNNPHWHGKVVLMMVVVPSRIGVEHYRMMKRQIDEQVGKINGKFGNLSWMPIIYQYKHLPLKQLVALYSLSDVALVTPIRDGMNLIAKEYLASRTDGTGVLILSEMAGAARELGEALIINPNDRVEIASAIKEALEMSLEEQKVRLEAMQRRLRRYDVVKWGSEFINELFTIKEAQTRFEARLLGVQQEALVRDYRQARSRILFLDYDGTLVPFASDPRVVKPDEGLLELLRKLSSDPKNEVVIISGRDRKTLEEWFAGLEIGLVAEHGVWLKRKSKPWRMLKPLENNWKEELLPVLELYVDRLPGSFIEEKEFSLAWHYRPCQPELASVRANELVDYLVDFTSSTDIQVLHGNKVVEIRCAGINKGVAGLFWLMDKDYDFIFSAGDDWTDEDLFKVLPEKAYSIRVGIANTNAKYNLLNYQDVLKILRKLAWSEE
ncbi:MAG: bifunctional alpha,alpha-trehalose-phosphate synthase (UDP-forming)/trehalose-phosphatase [Candidatus Aminicenantes bacterium]|nr:bifunctional alpha,alpha-trehalose-phosphate synthase (UDP-forming)/trehalose-phosphatase [Candidatus Aminicenantes bacterium]